MDRSYYYKAVFIRSKLLQLQIIVKKSGVKKALLEQLHLFLVYHCSLLHYLQNDQIENLHTNYRVAAITYSDKMSSKMNGEVTN